jgi:ATP/ADP translocase
MVNPFEISWLWRGFKGHSMTFALLFASCMVGWTLSEQVGRLLQWLGVHWLYVLLLPGFFFMWLAKKEPQWFPDELLRKRWARRMIVGSILLAVLIGWVKRN